MVNPNLLAGENQTAGVVPDVINAQLSNSTPAPNPPAAPALTLQEASLLNVLGTALNVSDVTRLRAVAAKLTKEQLAKLLKAAHATKAPTWADVGMFGIRQDVRSAASGIPGAIVGVENAAAKGYVAFLGIRALIRKIF